MGAAQGLRRSQARPQMAVEVRHRRRRAERHASHLCPLRHRAHPDPQGADVSPFKGMARPTRHSYSSLKMFKECPAKYGYSYIMKLPSPSTGAMDRGTRLHKLCEDYLLHDGPE